jgi:hypothetical protein
MLFKNIFLSVLSFASSALCNDHFYTLDPNGEIAPQLGYVSEGIAAWVYKDDYLGPAGNLKRRPVYRWNNGEDHFYTNNESEQPSGYNFEGIAFYEPVYPFQPSLVPFYRWYNSHSGDHFYTTDPSGELASQGGYVLEGNIGWVWKPTVNPIPSNAVPLYRWYHS